MSMTPAVPPPTPAATATVTVNNPVPAQRTNWGTAVAVVAIIIVLAVGVFMCTRLYSWWMSPTTPVGGPPSPITAMAAPPPLDPAAAPTKAGAAITPEIGLALDWRMERWLDGGTMVDGIYCEYLVMHDLKTQLGTEYVSVCGKQVAFESISNAASGQLELFLKGVKGVYLRWEDIRGVERKPEGFRVRSGVTAYCVKLGLTSSQVDAKGAPIWNCDPKP